MYRYNIRYLVFHFKKPKLIIYSFYLFFNRILFFTIHTAAAVRNKTRKIYNLCEIVYKVNSLLSSSH